MFSELDKQIARSWYRYSIEPRLAKLTGKSPRKSGPRIAVVGNCQSFGVAYAMKALDPNACVDLYWAIAKSRADVKLLAKTLATYDYVFSHEFPAGCVRGGGSKELKDLLDKVILFPVVTFAAFHPDLIYLQDAMGNGHINGPVGPLHSALAVFAFRQSLSLTQANALFNRNVYEALGYFDMWNGAAADFISASKRKFEIDFSEELMNWARRGVFMYSIIHPKPFVLFDVAKKLFSRAGLAIREIDKDYFAIDDLARAEIFPVYPPIGELFGVSGSYTFKRSNYQLSSKFDYFMTLPEYLEKCFDAYRRVEGAPISHPRVDAWLSDPSIVGTLTELSRQNLKSGLLPAH
jgi:hypothetical protein